LAIVVEQWAWWSFIRHDDVVHLADDDGVGGMLHRIDDPTNARRNPARQHRRAAVVRGPLRSKSLFPAKSSSAGEVNGNAFLAGGQQAH